MNDNWKWNCFCESISPAQMNYVINVWETGEEVIKVFCWQSTCLFIIILISKCVRGDSMSLAYLSCCFWSN